MVGETRKRKADHIRICLTKDVQSHVSTGFEDIHLIHEALPEISFKEIDTTTNIFGYRLSSPIIIAGMTGGTKKAAKINANLAEAAGKLGLGMGVGSQRVAIEDPKQEYSFRIVREKAPKAFIIANIGCVQLVKGYGVDKALKAVEMVEANALAIHLNSLQEAVQVEGQADFKESLKKIRELTQTLTIPVIVKETGSGISAETAKKLEEAGVKGIDVGGAGGTSWAAVEYYRAKELRKRFNQELSLTFWDWGIPTAISLIETVKTTNLTTIATGGIRNGIDVAKALALGAHAAGIALPLLKTAAENVEKTVWKLKRIINELKTAMFLTGKKSIEELRKETPLIVTGKTAEWLKTRGFKPEEYALRKPL
ncbi:MAG: type 2 isopentenyl-diphosphate Delta-isomerase [Candidatus Hecatellales archaeon]|nr:MAG: type 2 isopentenyl-diphosphate Delta-isomerase [Candidatus Hecatellales archaeon]